MNCVVCNKSFITTERKSKIGTIDATIIGSCYCSRKCRQIMKYTIMISDLHEDIDDIQTKIDKLKGKKKRKKKNV